MTVKEALVKCRLFFFFVCVLQLLYLAVLYIYTLHVPFDATCLI